jgi:SAM-dependent MidA family methyltransferase
MDVLGYTSQARFLMNCGLAELIPGPDGDPAARASHLAAINTLLSEAEMGELFKVLAVGRTVDEPLMGFAVGDRRHRL